MAKPDPGQMFSRYESGSAQSPDTGVGTRYVKALLAAFHVDDERLGVIDPAGHILLPQASGLLRRPDDLEAAGRERRKYCGSRELQF